MITNQDGCNQCYTDVDIEMLSYLCWVVLRLLMQCEPGIILHVDIARSLCATVHWCMTWCVCCRLLLL